MPAITDGLLLLPLLFVPAPACAPEEDAPGASDEDVAALVAAANSTAADLHGALAQDGNLCWSPASVYAGLFLVRAGARGSTAAALDRAMHLPPGEQPPAAAFGTLLARVERERDGEVVRVANALWGQRGYAFEEATLDVLERDLGAELRRVDFGDRDAAGTINRWIEKRTQGRIRDMIDPDRLGPDVRLVLTNALYFRARWQTELRESNTRPEAFHLASGSPVTVPTMHGELLARRYHETDELQLVELPYREGSSMVLVLPRSRSGLDALERELSPQRLATWLEAGLPSQVRLAVPRFTFESRVPLKQALGELGLASLFARDADLTGFNGGVEPLWIDEALHQTYVAVDEEGTEAAAVTSFSAMGAAFRGEPHLFQADHPFLFMIVAGGTGQVLFLGRVADPRG